jgi:hypothetical protein
MLMHDEAVKGFHVGGNPDGIFDSKGKLLVLGPSFVANAEIGGLRRRQNLIGVFGILGMDSLYENKDKKEGASDHRCSA